MKNDPIFVLLFYPTQLLLSTGDIFKSKTTNFSTIIGPSGQDNYSNIRLILKVRWAIKNILDYITKLQKKKRHSQKLIQIYGSYKGKQNVLCEENTKPT